MPKDHYVSQTFLNQFIDPEINLLHIYKKTNGQHIITKPSAVCASNDGSSNIYFRDTRIIEDYLKIIEPNWSECVQALREKNLSPRVKYLISSYIAFLRSCNPTAKRWGKNHAEFLVESIRPILAKKLDGNKEKDLIAQLLNPKIKVSVKPDFPQAHMMMNLKNLIDRFYFSSWEIFYNETAYPFITCDYPAVYWNQATSYIADLFIPITPCIGIVIKLSSKKPTPDSFKKVGASEVRFLNKLTVQSAEKIVISSFDAPWIISLISKYKNWRVEPFHSERPTNSGGKYIITKIGAKEVV